MKSEPSVSGIEHLKAMPKQRDHWEGVRNYQARNMMRDEMKVGDLAFFYHSNCPIPGIVGVMEIVKEGYPDPKAFDPESKYFDPKSDPENPRWFVVDVQLQKMFNEVISLQELRAQPALADMWILRRGSRLSITPVTAAEWKYIMKMIKS